MHWKSLWFAALLASLPAGSPLAAQSQSAAADQTDARGDDLYSMDLKSLLDLKVITASKFSEKLSDAPGIISVVTKEEIRRFGAITVREVLERVPGLSGTTAYFTDRSMVAARGDQTRIDGGHILILINGRPTREILEGGIISDVLESFPVDILERIEVIKGPGSVLYGSNAFSAVINLITQKAEGSGLTIKGAPGRAGTLATSVQTMFQQGDFSLVGAGQLHQEPDWNSPYGFRDPLTGVVSWQNVIQRDGGPGAYLGVNYRGLSFMSSFMQWQSSSYARGLWGLPRWRRGFADLGYGLRASDRWDMNFNVTYTRTTFATVDYPNIRRDAYEAVLEWTNYLRPTDQDQVTFGTLYNHIEGNERYFGISPAITISQGGRHSGALYAQLDHHLRDDLKLIGGFQVNKIGNLALDVVPRAGLLWNPSAHTNVKAIYSQAFRAPSINETRLDHPGLEGNPNLKPEKVGTFDLGLTYQTDRLEMGANYFHSHLTDRIMEYTSPLRWKYMNLGDATFQGVELEGKWYLRKHFLLLGSFLYQTSQDANGNSNVSPIPNFGAKAGISYQAENGLTTSLFDSYQGNVDPRYAGVLNPRAGSYHLLHSHIRFDLSRHLGFDPRKGLALFAHVENLADRQVWLPDWGGNSGDTIPMYRGRTIYFGIEVSLKKE